MANIRSVFHVYIPSFCALLEQIRKPEVARKPLMITRFSGNTEFVVSASPEAESQGVHEGMTARHAGRYCPDGAFLSPDWEYYGTASKRVLDILASYSPTLEPHGLDRAYIDLTGSEALFGTTREMADSIHRKVEEEIGIPISIGIAANKLLAQIAASRCRSGRTLLIPAGRETDFLSPLSVRLLPGIGREIERQLQNLGVTTIGELASVPENALARLLGINGRKLYLLSHGKDPTPVQSLYPPDRIFICYSHDLMDGDLQPELALLHLARMCERIGDILKKRNGRTGRITLALQFDGDKASICSYTPKLPISSTQEIHSVAQRLFRETACDEEIISIALTAHDLQSVRGVQLSIFGDDERKARLDHTLQSITTRFGERSLVKASSLLMAG